MGPPETAMRLDPGPQQPETVPYSGREAPCPELGRAAPEAPQAAPGLAHAAVSTARSAGAAAPAVGSAGARACVPEGRAAHPGGPPRGVGAPWLEGPERRWEIYGVLVLAFVAIASAARWRLYPVFADPYYHMAVIEGFDQAGGIVSDDFWEMAPSGRPHLYPPSLHAAGHVAGFLGVSARSFVTFVSWAFYPLSLLAAWLWLREVSGPRGAFFGVALLLGPGAWFWNQTVHTANALVMVVAPLALLALERERFLACAAANFVATAAHPMGLFLPAALAANAFLRRERLLPGLLAALAPAALYLPWLVHVWAHRAFLSAVRLGRAVEAADRGFDAGALALGFAALGLVEIGLGGRKALGLVGPALGFAVAVPLGLAGRFLIYSVHWPLAAFGGLGAARFLERLERRPRLRPFAEVASVSLAFFALAAHPALHVRRVPPAISEYVRAESGVGLGSEGASLEGRGAAAPVGAAAGRAAAEGGDARGRRDGTGEPVAVGVRALGEGAGESAALARALGDPAGARAERGVRFGVARAYLTLRPSVLVKLLDYSTRPDPVKGLGAVGAIEREEGAGLRASPRELRVRAASSGPQVPRSQEAPPVRGGAPSAGGEARVGGLPGQGVPPGLEGPLGQGVLPGGGSSAGLSRTARRG
mgnify:CR=1 FL=1